MIATAWHRFVFDEYRASWESLVNFRIGYAALLLALYVPNYLWIAHYPDTFFRPPIGLTAFFFTGFPPAWVFVALNVVLIGALVYLLAGRGVWTATLLTTGCLLFGNAWAYSFGKIDHDILLVILPPFLLAAGWDGKGPTRAWPLALFALTVAAAMFTAAFQKAVTGWLDPTVSAVFGHTLRNAIADHRDSPARHLVLQMLPYAAWKAADYSTLLFEAGFLVAMFRRTAFLAVCSVACLFHFGVAMLMQITFLSNVIAYAAFVDWKRIVERLWIKDAMTGLRAWLERRTHLELLVSAGLFTAMSLLWRHPLLFLFPRMRGAVSLLLMAIAMVASLIFIASLAASSRASLAARRRNSCS
jgi:hypothetical protein